MRLAGHVGNCLVRYHANAPAFRHVNKFQLQCMWKPLLHPSMSASFPRRGLFLSSSDPITISEDRQTITFRLNNGETITQKISATPKANRDKLANALASLLATPETSEPSNHLSFGTTQWQLDALGDAIHRHTAHPSTGECEHVEKWIMNVAENMNHHPHITRGDKYMTITCTTHSPRGLSVRDTRLAHEINDILDAFDVTEPMNENAAQDLDEVEKQLAAHRQQMIALNRQKISEALESCSCDTAKPKSTTSPE